MNEETKLTEIILKLLIEDCNRIDELEILGHFIIELTVNNPEEKRKAKLMLSSAKEEAKKTINDNNKNNIN